ncbi:MAG: calcium-binding protein, partial [Candidatus Accumulibacter sp. UW26]
FGGGVVTINLATGITSVAVVGGNTEIISNFENAWGSQGSETIVGSAVNNFLDGQGGNDTLSGGFGNDSVLGGDGDDVLYGNQDNDALSGGNGNDLIYGGQGNDSLDGGIGNDLVNGGLGSDLLSGGAGSDIFRFDTALGIGNIDLITDFQSGDLLSLSASIFTAFSGGPVVLGEHLAYEATTGAVSYDADGAAAGAAEIFAIIGIGIHPGSLLNIDFVLA